MMIKMRVLLLLTPDDSTSSPPFRGVAMAIVLGAVLCAAAAACSACSSVLGLEELPLRTAEAGDSAAASTMSGEEQQQQQQHDSTHRNDAGHANAPGQSSSLCASSSSSSSDGGAGGAGPPVYAFVDSTEAWRYATDSTPPSGFVEAGIAFRLPASPSAVGVGGTPPSSSPLYLIKNDTNGDYALTTNPDEGRELGYVTVGVAIGAILPTPTNGISVAGAVPLVRYKKNILVRHRASIDNNELTWSPEQVLGYVCPR